MSRSFGPAIILLSAIIALPAASPAIAITTFSAMLDGVQETAINDSAATGTGTATLSDDQNIFSATLTFSGLSAPAGRSFIQCCAPVGDDGLNVLDLAVPLAASGSVTRTFDLTALSTYASGFLTANGGTVALARSGFLTGLFGGYAYFNLRDTAFPDGEIRGQLNQDSGGGGGGAGGGGGGGTGTIPEPASWSLMVAGFALAGGATRRRQRSVTA